MPQITIGIVLLASLATFAATISVSAVHISSHTVSVQRNQLSSGFKSAGLDRLLTTLLDRPLSLSAFVLLGEMFLNVPLTGATFCRIQSEGLLPFLPIQFNTIAHRLDKMYVHALTEYSMYM
jgi:hypothetical protein